jgi:nitroreductase
MAAFTAAEVPMDALQALTTRRSVRVYRADPVPRDLLEQVLDAARHAATANNLQPWEFVVVTDRATRQRLTAATDHGQQIALAPVCIAVFCKDCKYYLEDGANASMNLLVAAHALGLGGCWVAGDKKPYADEVRALLGVPAGYRLVSLVTLGYAAERPVAPKRPLRDVVHWERF